MMEEWISAIKDLGFPVAMVLYFVLRFEKILNNNTLALTKLIDKLK